jgi:hypothetical protein
MGVKSKNSSRIFFITRFYTRNIYITKEEPLIYAWIRLYMEAIKTYKCSVLLYESC